MDGEQRREVILEILRGEEKPISGTYLAKKFKVSRQVIVQDVALLRAKGNDILATARGYILNEETNAIEIWFNYEEEPYVAYLFNYEEGVIVCQ